MLKKCKRCELSKPIEEFSRHSGHKDGRQSRCKKCASEISKDWYKNHKRNPETVRRLNDYNKAKIQELKNEVDQIKRFSGCKYCKEKEPCCLDFHHPGEKDREVSAWIRLKSKQKLYEEIARCIVICSNCHRKVHAGILIEE